MNFSSTPNTSVQQVPQLPIFLINTPLILKLPLFQWIFQPSGQDQENGKRTCCWLPPRYFRINLKDTSFYIAVCLLRFYLSLEFLLSFFSNLYIPPWLGKIFKFVVFRLLENAFASQKIESRHFFSCPRHNSPPVLCHPHTDSPPPPPPPQVTVFQKSVTPPPGGRGVGKKLWNQKEKLERKS